MGGATAIDTLKHFFIGDLKQKMQESVNNPQKVCKCIDLTTHLGADKKNKSTGIFQRLFQDLLRFHPLDHWRLASP